MAWRSRQRHTTGTEPASRFLRIDANQTGEVREPAVGQPGDGVGFMNDNTKTKHPSRDAGRHGSVAAGAYDDFGSFANQNAAGREKCRPDGADRLQPSGRRLACPRQRRDQFRALAALQRQTRFEPGLAADETSLAAEFSPVCEEYFESREDVPRRTAACNGNAPPG